MIPASSVVTANRIGKEVRTVTDSALNLIVRLFTPFDHLFTGQRAQVVGALRTRKGRDAMGCLDAADVEISG